MGFWLAVSLRLLTLFCYTSALVQTMPTVNKTKTKKTKNWIQCPLPVLYPARGVQKRFVFNAGAENSPQTHYVAQVKVLKSGRQRCWAAKGSSIWPLVGGQGGEARQQAAQSPCCRRRGRSLQSLQPSAPQSPTSLSWSPMTHRKWKLRASRAVPSRSPSAVRYGMEKLSGSLPLRHMEWTIQSEMHSSSSTWRRKRRRKKRLGQRLKTGMSEYLTPGIILGGGAVLIGLWLHRLDSVLVQFNIKEDQILEGLCSACFTVQRKIKI